MLAFADVTSELSGSCEMSIACTANVPAVPDTDTSSCAFDSPVCVTPVVFVTE